MRCEEKIKNDLSFSRGADGNDVVCVFACPGRIEEILGAPVQGVTGNNLYRLFEELWKRNASLREKLCVCKVAIANASDIPHYRSKEGCSSTVPNEEEIKKHSEKLREQIRGMRTIICFGCSAAKAVSALLGVKSENLVVIEVCHLGTEGLRYVRKSGDEKLRMEFPTRARIKTVAEYLESRITGEAKHYVMQEFKDRCFEEQVIKKGKIK